MCADTQVKGTLLKHPPTATNVFCSFSSLCFPPNNAFKLLCLEQEDQAREKEVGRVTFVGLCVDTYCLSNCVMTHKSQLLWAIPSGVDVLDITSCVRKVFRHCHTSAALSFVSRLAGPAS